jgi:hypothetical protein
MAECFFGIARFARQAEPQHVHWCSIVIAFETGFRPNGGMATVASDNQICAYLKFTVRGLRLDTDNAPVLFDQARRFGLHPQVECPIALAAIRKKIEKVPLRHQRNEFATNRQMVEMTDHDAVLADLQRYLLND